MQENRGSQQTETGGDIFEVMPNYVKEKLESNPDAITLCTSLKLFCQIVLDH